MEVTLSASFKLPHLSRDMVKVKLFR
uniref:Uncharacterized protein n=1 Tax=Anguilla anguilla TaxID=7936 RepID=A0A0E9RBT5_ANGAN